MQKEIKEWHRFACLIQRSYRGWRGRLKYLEKVRVSPDENKEGVVNVLFFIILSFSLSPTHYHSFPFGSAGRVLGPHAKGLLWSTGQPHPSSMAWISNTETCPWFLQAQSLPSIPWGDEWNREVLILWSEADGFIYIYIYRLGHTESPLYSSYLWPFRLTVLGKGYRNTKRHCRFAWRKCDYRMKKCV